MTEKLLRMAGKSALGMTLALIIGALCVLTILPRAVHGSALNVLTGSMTPTIPAGSIVLVRPIDPAALEIGDVVTFQKAPGRAEFITHRIIEIHADTNPATLTTKGDANPGPDLEPIPVTSVRGKVWFHVPHLGAWRDGLNPGSAGLLLAIVGLLAYAIKQLVSEIRDRRRVRQTEWGSSIPKEGLFNA